MTVRVPPTTFIWLRRRGGPPWGCGGGFPICSKVPQNFETLPMDILERAGFVLFCIISFGWAGGWIALSGVIYREDGRLRSDAARSQPNVAQVVVGICGAVVAVAGCTKLFGLDIDSYVKSGEPEFSILLFVAAISVLGGYSAPTLIPLLANAAIAQLKRKVDALGTEVKDNKKHRVKAALTEDRPRHALKLINEVLQDKPTDDEALSLKASALKRLGDLDKAIVNVRDAIKRADQNKSGSHWPYHFNLACYLALCDNGIKCSEIETSLRRARELVQDDEDLRRLSSALDKDPDLDKFREKCSHEYAALKRSLV